MEINRIGSVTDRLGEGPLWDVGEQALYWVDSLGCRIHRYHPASGTFRDWSLPCEIGSMALREQGGAVLALATGFHLFDFATGASEPIADPESDEPRTRFNDGKVDRQGRFVAGSMVRDIRERERGLGALYRLDGDFAVERLCADVIVANGPCFSPDGGTLYFADSPRRKIFAFDYDIDGGRLGGKRVLVDVDELHSAPDGATVDSQGYVWSALVLSGRIARFAPDGHLDRIIEMPVTHPSSVMFGGAELDVLYVTSIGEAITRRGVGPGSGSLCEVRGLGVRGLPEPRFRG